MYSVDSSLPLSYMLGARSSATPRHTPGAYLKGSELLFLYTIKYTLYFLLTIPCLPQASSSWYQFKHPFLQVFCLQLRQPAICSYAALQFSFVISITAVVNYWLTFIYFISFSLQDRPMLSYKSSAVVEICTVQFRSHQPYVVIGY